MRTAQISKLIKTTLFTASLLLLTAASAVATSFTLPATTSGPGKINLGFFSGGTTLYITTSGQISLLTGWDTFADGSLVNPIVPIGPLANYGYANAGASGYPTLAGGDGINHFSGGGANYDVNAATFGLAGALTTDTTNPNAIRLGAVVGTFNPSPAQSDWFFVGNSSVIIVPGGGANFYVAVDDTTYENNSGAYSGELSTSVPEPSAVALGGLALSALVVRGKSLRRSTPSSPPVLRAVDNLGISTDETNLPAPLLSSIRTYAGFELQGVVGESYRVEYTLSLPPTNWITLTNLILPQSPFLIVDTTAPVHAQRFYRAVPDN